MPTAVDILSRTSRSSTDSADEANRFIISEDLRTITMPSDQGVLGVTNDHDVRRVYFSMPRECDGTVLSAFTPYVNYSTPSGERGFYVSDDLEDDGDVLTFSWVVSRRVCSEAGTVTFSVTLRLMAQDGETIEKEFNTTTAEMTVLQGLNTTGSEVIEQYVDEISGYINAALESRLSNRNIVILGSPVSTYSNLPRSASVGEMRNVADTGRNYVWTGEVWDDLGGVDSLVIETATDAQIDALFE